MANVLINLTDVSYTYFDKPILAGLSWEIQAGQKIGLVGANGAGKSTLLGLILGQHTPDAGAIFRVKDLTIGYLPQDATALLPLPHRSGGEGRGAGGCGGPHRVGGRALRLARDRAAAPRPGRDRGAHGRSGDLRRRGAAGARVGRARAGCCTSTRQPAG